MIVKPITLGDFQNCEALNQYFTPDALEAMFYMLDELSKTENIIWDPVGFRCEFSENSPSEIREIYSNILELASSPNDTELYENLQYFTTATALPNGNILYVDF